MIDNALLLTAMLVFAEYETLTAGELRFQLGRRNSLAGKAGDIIERATYTGLLESVDERRFRITSIGLEWTERQLEGAPVASIRPQCPQCKKWMELDEKNYQTSKYRGVVCEPCYREMIPAKATNRMVVFSRKGALA